MMNSAPLGIFNQFINQYTGCITNLQSGSIALGQDLFNSVALISVGLLGLNYLLKKNVDMVEANIELIRWLVYLDCFYAFITNFPSIYTLIYNSIQQIGNYLGSKASGSPVNISPGNIISIGFNISKKILFSNIRFNLLRSALMIPLSILTAVVVMYCFAVIGIELILVQIGSQIILAGGIFLLAFSGLQWTRDYAERYVHTFFHVGIKMIFIYILVGIGAGLAQNWIQILDQAPLTQIVDTYLVIGLSSFVFYKLCLKVPDQAVSYLTGRLSMGFDAAASVNAVPRVVAKVVTGAVGGAAGIAGMSKAVSVANQAAKTTLESHGKKANLLNTSIETIKTLGAANEAVKQEAWDRKIDDTKGGKLAKNILADIPKPKKQTTGRIKQTSQDDSMDYAI